MRPWIHGQKKNKIRVALPIPTHLELVGLLSWALQLRLLLIRNTCKFFLLTVKIPPKAIKNCTTPETHNGNEIGRLKQEVCVHPLCSEHPAAGDTFTQHKQFERMDNAHGFLINMPRMWLLSN